MLGGRRAHALLQEAVDAERRHLGAAKVGEGGESGHCDCKAEGQMLANGWLMFGQIVAKLSSCVNLIEKRAKLSKQRWPTFGKIIT